MLVRMLGPVEIRDADGATVLVNGAKRAALLAALVVRAGHTVSMERLIAELWGERPPANAANALQAHIRRLRKIMALACGQPDRIRTTPPGYSLHLEPGETDAGEFAATVARARAATDPDAAVELLHAALELWRGPALSGCRLGDICAAEAVLLEENRLGALESLYDASLRAGRHGELIRELEEAVAAHPLRERFYDQLMVALHRCDRQSEAIGVYDRARRRLLHDLGVEPGPALRARVQAILEPGAADLSAEVAALQAQVDALTTRLRTLTTGVSTTQVSQGGHARG